MSIVSRGLRTLPIAELTVIDTRRQDVAGRRDLFSTVIAG